MTTATATMAGGVKRWRSEGPDVFPRRHCSHRGSSACSPLAHGCHRCPHVVVFVFVAALPSPYRPQPLLRARPPAAPVRDRTNSLPRCTLSGVHRERLLPLPERKSNTYTHPHRLLLSPYLSLYLHINSIYTYKYKYINTPTYMVIQT